MPTRQSSISSTAPRAVLAAGGVALAALLACGGPASQDPSVASTLEVAAAPGSAESNLAVGPDGRVVISWLEPAGEGHALRFATLDASGWSAPREVARGEDWFVNWADFPSVVPLQGSLWAAHWLARQPAGGYAYDVVLALSQDGGESWRDIGRPHTDGTATEHGFVSLFSWDGALGVVWLDGRNMEPADDSAAAGHAHGSGGMTLRAARIGGAGAINREAVVDELTCDCCQTAVALSADGPVVAYRDRSPDEIRDIFVARAEGGAWSAPVAVADDGWRIEGCPVNGPAIAANGQEVVVAWFTGAADRARVQLAFSADSGRSFESPIEVDGAAPLGRVDVVLLDGGDAVVSWLAAAEEGAAVTLRRVTPTGRLGPLRTIGRTEATRPAGFPQLVSSGGQLVVSWTEASDGATRVRSARLPASGV